MPACGPQPARLPCPWDFPGKNTELGCHFPHQRIFPDQGVNFCLLYLQADSLPLSHQGSPEVPLPSPHLRNKLVPCSGNKQRNLFLALAPPNSTASGAPIKSCLNSLSGLWSISFDWGRSRTLISISYSPKESFWKTCTYSSKVTIAQNIFGSSFLLWSE